MYERTYPHKRFERTLTFLEKHLRKDVRILDLGENNPLADRMRQAGYQVINTQGEDLDTDPSTLLDTTYTAVTAFEIFEHLVSPFTVLQAIQANKLVASVPLKLWFAKAYRSTSDPRDRHFHEFESWQFDWLLEKAGWNILDSEMFTHPVRKIGIRPILRLFTPRYYLVYAERLDPKGA